MTTDELGKWYEQYIVRMLKCYKNVELNIYKTKEEQYNIGESKEGYEIKFDNKLKTTGNLYIETHERRNKRGNFVPSGILRKDNTLYYCIGNEDVVYIFNKEWLKEYYKKSPKYIETETSKGFLILDVEYKDFHKDICEKLSFIDEFINKKGE